ncbi:hypothetical protein A4A49_52508 [Nicotiana attenuata]|uniref:Uncharacterized protein n=1 Tax=Nicotiana attenuata TaxID=49451 RepID=A0A1J6IRB4_NICAT|nr:hypothetical protein A4A49_52508 [Nicotiana attenuata]
MEGLSSQIPESKKRKDFPEIDDDDESEEEKVDKLYEIIRSFSDARHLVINRSITPKISENQELAENIELNKINKKKKKNKCDKEEEAAVATTCYEHQTMDLLGSKRTALGVKHQCFSGDQIHDDTQGFGLNLSL